MEDDIKISLGEVYYRKKENWFKELFIKLKIIKPKYKTLSKTGELTINGGKQ